MARIYDTIRAGIRDLAVAVSSEISHTNTAGDNTNVDAELKRIDRKQFGHSSYRGHFSITAYDQNDVVLFGTNLYQARRSFTPDAISNPRTDTANWEPVGFFKGIYNPAIQYELGDLVLEGSDLYHYIANTPSTGNTPSGSPTQWSRISGVTAEEVNTLIDAALEDGGSIAEEIIRLINERGARIPDTLTRFEPVADKTRGFINRVQDQHTEDTQIRLTDRHVTSYISILNDTSAFSSSNPDGFISSDGVSIAGNEILGLEDLDQQVDADTVSRKELYMPISHNYIGGNLNLWTVRTSQAGSAAHFTEFSRIIPDITTANTGLLQSFNYTNSALSAAGWEPVIDAATGQAIQIPNNTTFRMSIVAWREQTAAVHVNIEIVVGDGPVQAANHTYILANTNNGDSNEHFSTAAMQRLNITSQEAAIITDELIRHSNQQHLFETPSDNQNRINGKVVASVHSTDGDIFSGRWDSTEAYENGNRLATRAYVMSLMGGGTTPDMGDIETQIRDHVKAEARTSDLGGRDYAEGDFPDAITDKWHTEGEVQNLARGQLTQTNLNSVVNAIVGTIRGWTPTYRVVTGSNNEAYLQITGWTGGTGATPTTGLNQYLGTSGFVSSITQAFNFRGATGPAGISGGRTIIVNRLLPIATVTPPAAPTATGYNLSSNSVTGLNPADSGFTGANGWVVGNLSGTPDYSTNRLWRSEALLVINQDGSASLGNFGTPYFLTARDGTNGSPDTAAQIRDKLQTLTGANRLPATAIRDLPTNGGSTGGGSLPFNEVYRQDFNFGASRNFMYQNGSSPGSNEFTFQANTWYLFRFLESNPVNDSFGYGEAFLNGSEIRAFSATAAGTLPAVGESAIVQGANIGGSTADYYIARDSSNRMLIGVDTTSNDILPLIIYTVGQATASGNDSRIPDPADGDTGKPLQVNSDNDGYTLGDVIIPVPDPKDGSLNQQLRVNSDSAYELFTPDNSGGGSPGNPFTELFRLQPWASPSARNTVVYANGATPGSSEFTIPAAGVQLRITCDDANLKAEVWTSSDELRALTATTAGTDVRGLSGSRLSKTFPYNTPSNNFTNTGSHLFYFARDAQFRLLVGSSSTTNPPNVVIEQVNGFGAAPTPRVTRACTFSLFTARGQANNGLTITLPSGQTLADIEHIQAALSYDHVAGDPHDPIAGHAYVSIPVQIMIGKNAAGNGTTDANLTDVGDFMIPLVSRGAAGYALVPINNETTAHTIAGTDTSISVRIIDINSSSADTGNIAFDLVTLQSARTIPL